MKHRKTIKNLKDNVRISSWSHCEEEFLKQPTKKANHKIRLIHSNVKLKTCLNESERQVTNYLKNCNKKQRINTNKNILKILTFQQVKHKKLSRKISKRYQYAFHIEENRNSQ